MNSTTYALLSPACPERVQFLRSQIERKMRKANQKGWEGQIANDTEELQEAIEAGTIPASEIAEEKARIACLRMLYKEKF